VQLTCLPAHGPAPLRPIITVAYSTGMLQGEIFNLTWGQVDWQKGFIRLRPEDTQTDAGRLAPLNRELADMPAGHAPGPSWG
jgi:integrase